jgi:hypothetical protein
MRVYCITLAYLLHGNQLLQRFILIKLPFVLWYYKSTLLSFWNPFLKSSTFEFTFLRILLWVVLAARGYKSKVNFKHCVADCVCGVSPLPAQKRDKYEL